MDTHISGFISPSFHTILRPASLTSSILSCIDKAALGEDGGEVCEPCDLMKTDSYLVVH